MGQYYAGISQFSACRGQRFHLYGKPTIRPSEIAQLQSGVSSKDNVRLAVMSVSSREGILERAKESLQLLACSAESQILLLPSFVRAADELVLDFDHWRDVLIENCGSELTAEQIASLAAIDALFSRFSRGGSDYKPEFWTDEALRNSQDWEVVRREARQALARFGWPAAIPPSHADQYVGRPQKGKS